MKIALVQDQILVRSGAERAFLEIIRAFPEADVFTLAFNQERTFPDYKGMPIRTSLLGSHISDHERLKLLFPLATYAMQVLDLRRYDVVLTSSTTVAKYIRRLRGLHVSYCHYPTRAIWEHATYFKPSWRYRIFRLLLPYFRSRDLRAARGINYFIANSDATRAAIEKYYQRSAEVLHCPVDYDRFAAGISEAKGASYLLVSRLEPWKMLDYAIEAFTQLRLPLRVVGSGPHAKALARLAGPTITFVGQVSDQALVGEYGRARAVVFPTDMEYGLIPLEAHAAGTPVIALGRRGAVETTAAFDPSDPAASSRATAVLYDQPSVPELMNAVRTFEKVSFRRDVLQAHARGFAPEAFRRRLRAIVERVYAERPIEPETAGGRRDRTVAGTPPLRS